MSTTARRIAGTAAASAVTLGLLVTGTGTAAADDPGPSTAPTSQGPIILNAEQATYVCGTRIPAVLSRVDRVTARVNADATTRGSTAWLTDRRDKARAAGHDELADRIQERIDRRPEALSRLADAKQRVTDFRDGNCAT